MAGLLTNRYGKGSELDRWARALGVDNDDAALKALAQVIASLRAAQDQAAEVARATSDAPDPEVSTGCGTAVREIDAALDGLVQLYHKFHRHQRGR
jgi:hypothetical protein